MRPFEAIFVPEAAAEAVSDRAWLDAMLDAERALANASSRVGLVPADAAAMVAAACVADLYDEQQLALDGRAAGNPVEPLVRAMRGQVGDAYADYVHRGATSQDILDTAAMLVAQRACAGIDDQLGLAAARCAALADEHRGTVMAARTLLQQAVPTTFGAKAAGWLVALVESRTRLAGVAGSLPAQLGGAGGTLAAFGERGLEVASVYAEEVELREPTVPWHTLRTPVTDLAGALAGCAGTLGKIAGDVVLLAQTEVAEVAESEPGASSTMPHKRNPVAAVLARACAGHVRANAVVLFDSAEQEHERAAGAWHAEWSALSAALAAAWGAADAVRRSLDGVRIDAGRMRANLSDDTLSEAGRLGLPAERPEEYLGSADALIDRARALHRE
ncbi:MAG TPA: 3-carboxy-cis,cis-muconate cycloisomerase [Gaiellaceae bacterium]|nr:3-carboxy-cis,cis-muconate cycloisomerase [Gaiellaceae bacterium]